MRRACLLCVVAILLSVSSSTAGLPGSDLFLVSVGRGEGAAGSVWYTTVWIHNPNSAAVTVTASLLYRGQQNPSPEQQSVLVHSGETITLHDALVDLFGATSAVGALRFEAPSRIVVSARIFNQTGSDAAESQGQFMAGIPAEVAFGSLDSTDIPGITQPADDSFRCNFAMVETTGGDATVEATIFDGAGVELASGTYSLRPFEPIQQNLSHIDAGVTVDGGRLHLEITGGSGRVLALASMVGNGTLSQDPSTLEMEMKVAAASGDGDITAVLAGEGLSGGGTSGEVTLGVDTAGAAAGEVLLFDGSSLDWGSLSGGLSLPFDGESATSGAAFKVLNSSTSGNVFAIRGESTSTAGAAVYGWSRSSTGPTSGVLGQNSSANGAGVVGVADSSTGESIGVLGWTASSEGTGVTAQAASADGAPTGLLAEVTAEDGTALVALNLGGGTYAHLASHYRGLTASGSIAVEGFGTTKGGYFQVNGDAGEYGVGANIYSPGGIGVRAYTNSATGYSFYAAGSGTDYGPFTGAHEVKLSTEMPLEIRPGLIVSATGEAEVRADDGDAICLSSTLPTVSLSAVPQDPAVLGVLVAERPLPADHWYAPTDEDRFAVANALGEGRVWVTDSNGEIQVGDYITTSAVPGHGQRQDDDVLHSYTLGKAIEAVDWTAVQETVDFQGRTYKVHLIAVVYTSG